MKKRISAIAVYSAIIASFLYLLRTGWLKWGDLIIDTSRELWVPYAILNGKALYRDIFYIYGFLPPYLAAAMYKIFGVTLYSLIGLGIAVTALMTVFIYKISRFFLDEIVSGLVTLTFLFVFAFGFYCTIFNFIFPYSLASTLFTLFLAVCVFCFIKFIYGENRKYLLCWALFLSLTFLCRPEMAFMMWAGFMFIGCIFILKNKNKKALLFYLVSPLIIGIASYLLFLSVNNAFAGFKESVIDMYTYEIFHNSAINSERAGFSGLSYFIAIMLGSFVFYVLIVLLLGMVGSLSFVRNKKGSAKWILGISTVVFLAAYSKFFFQINYVIGQFFPPHQCIPVILVIGIGIFLYNIFLKNDVKLFKENLSLLTLFTISFLMIFRIILNTNPSGYGFFLVSLGLISYFIFFFRIVGDFIKRTMHAHEGFLKTGLVLIFLFLIIPYWNISLGLYRENNLRIKTGMGDVVCKANQMTLRFCEAATYLRNNLSKDETVVVFPEGASLNFFSKRENPTRYYVFLPVELGFIGEEKVLRSLEKSKIDYVVIVQRSSPEHMQTSFGINYGQKISRWITENYKVAKEIGPRPFTTGNFGVLILKRK